MPHPCLRPSIITQVSPLQCPILLSSQKSLCPRPLRAPYTTTLVLRVPSCPLRQLSSTSSIFAQTRIPRIRLTRRPLTLIPSPRGLSRQRQFQTPSPSLSPYLPTRILHLRPRLVLPTPTPLLDKLLISLLLRPLLPNRRPLLFNLIRAASFLNFKMSHPSASGCLLLLPLSFILYLTFVSNPPLVC